MPELLGLYGVKNEFGGVKSGVLDPVNPQGPKLEDQGPWKFGVTKKIFFACMQISVVLAFIWDPNLHNWTPIDPPRPQKPQKISKNRVGDPGVTLTICLI